MNRRDALRTMAAGIGSLLVPSWVLPKIPTVPLQEFCGDVRGMETPFVQGTIPFAYATCGRVCLRASSEECHTEPFGQLPNAAGLPWMHNYLRDWKRWPRERHIIAVDSPCPTCNGYGTATGKIGQECERCEGTGYEWWTANNINGKCEACLGHCINGPWCPACDGKAYGCYPGVQFLGDTPIAAEFDRKIRRHLHDVEYALFGWPGRKDIAHGVAFRFAGGHGILLPLEEKRAMERIREAG